MERKEELLDTLRRSFDRHAWHGPAVAEALADVTAEEALWRPAPHVHSIWQLTLHIVAWAGEVARRLDGSEPAEPAEGDWPEPGVSWEAAVHRVFEVRDVLLDKIRELSDADLDRLCGTPPDPPLGTGFTYGGMLEGLAQHNCYHAGQIVLLKKLARAA